MEGVREAGPIQKRNNRGRIHRMSRAVENIKAVHTSDAVFPLSVEQYHEMTRLGVLCDDDPVELIEGVLVNGIK